jgi:LmbE family N-acetylglucosaminyl deacetylase
MRRVAVLVFGLALAVRGALGQQAFPPVTAADRILIVAPHPDDEVLGAGGLIQQANAVGAAVHIVYLTNGDHNQIAFKLYRLRLHIRPRQYLAFGEMREREATAAMNVLGVGREQLTFLGYPDYGTLRVWRDYWGQHASFRSDATQATAVPYRDALKFEHPYKPENITADLLDVVSQFRPTKVFVAHPADTNPDHRAAANFVRLALLQLDMKPPPQIYYYVIHFGFWPRPPHYHPDLLLEPPHRLLDDGDWLSLSLTPGQTQKKHDAILENRTELTTSEYALLSFARANEIFATIDVLPVPIVPTNTVINWNWAVHSKSVGVGANEPADKPRGERTAAEELAAMALEETAYVRQGDELIAQVTLRNRLGKRANVHLLLFGYRRGADFATLPKLNVNITPFGNVHVFDDGKRLPGGSVTVTSVDNRLLVRVPLRLLGEPAPDLLFTATRANLGEVAPDDSAWHLFSLSNKTGNRHKDTD